MIIKCLYALAILFDTVVPNNCCYIPLPLGLSRRVVSLHTKRYSILSLSAQDPVVQKVDSNIHRISVDYTIGFINAYPVDSDLSSG